MIIHRTLLAAFAVGAAAVCTPHLAGAQWFTRGDAISTLPAPVPLETEGLFESTAARVGEDVFIAGQPTERALKLMRERGVATVVNLRTPEEMKRVPFDEAAVVAQLGMKYVYVPVRGNAEYPYSPETVTRFARALKEANGKVLLHCTVAWRASHLWAAYLIRERGVAVDSAIVNARAINLMDAHHSMSNGPQPIEEFLQRRLPTLGHRAGGD